MKDFVSFKEYCQFAGAKTFVDKGMLTPFVYKKGRLEAIGGFLVKPLMKSGDYTLRNIRNPLFLTAVVIAALALTTLAFYPAVFSSLVMIAPTIRLASYTLIQTTILGLGIRTLGRLNNGVLMDAWRQQQLSPIPIGAVIVKNDQ